MDGSGHGAGTDGTAGHVVCYVDVPRSQPARQCLPVTQSAGVANLPSGNEA